MVLRPLSETISLLTHPVTWIPGLYAGCLATVLIWLAFSGWEFIAGKLIFLGLVVAPFFVGGLLGCLTSGEYTLGRFLRSAPRFFFPVILPAILALTISILLVILFSIPFAIAGLGSEAPMMGGLFIGIMVPVLIFSFFSDNVAVTEGLAVLASLKRSMVITSQAFLTIISCIIISCLAALLLMLLTATLWGMILSEKFAGYLDLNMTQQQEIFGEFGMAEWQQTLGADGILVTSVIIGLFFFFLVPFFLVLKHQCYRAASAVPVTPPEQGGEYDEKGRWYKY